MKNKVFLTRTLHDFALKELKKKYQIEIHTGKIPIPKTKLRSKIKEIDRITSYNVCYTKLLRIKGRLAAGRGKTQHRSPAPVRLEAGITARAGGDVELIIRANRHRPGPVPTTGRQVGRKNLDRIGPKIAVVIPDAQQPTGFGDDEIISSKRQAVGPSESLGENYDTVGHAISVRIGKNENPALLRDTDVEGAVRADREETWAAKSGGED